MGGLGPTGAPWVLQELLRHLDLGPRLCSGVLFSSGLLKLLHLQLLHQGLLRQLLLHLLVLHLLLLHHLLLQRHLLLQQLRLTESGLLPRSL